MNKFPEPVFGPATETDIPALTRLFRLCFTEDSAFLSLYFSCCFPLCRTYVLRRRGIPVASASYLPVRYRQKHGKSLDAVYLYGVCTDPAHRRQGLSHLLLSRARGEIARSGAAFILCRPATPELFQLYAGMGYTEPVYRHFLELSFPAAQTDRSPFSARAVPLSDLRKLTDYDNRQAFSRISWSDPLLAYILSFYRMAEGWCLDSDPGSLIAVRDPDNEQILTVEYQTFAEEFGNNSVPALILETLRKQTFRPVPAFLKQVRILVSPDQIHAANDEYNVRSLLFAVADPITTAPDPAVFFPFPME